jgi:hypothetical protein
VIVDPAARNGAVARTVQQGRFWKQTGRGRADKRVNTGSQANGRTMKTPHLLRAFHGGRYPRIVLLDKIRMAQTPAPIVVLTARRRSELERLTPGSCSAPAESDERCLPAGAAVAPQQARG